MKRLLVLLFAVCAAAQISGCSVAPLKKAPIEKSMKIGIVIGDFGEHLTHTHIGTTVFVNFEDEYPLGFDIRKYVQDRAEQRLTQLGYTAKALPLDAAELNSLTATVRYSAWDGSMSFAPDAAATLSSIGSKYGVDLIITYSSSKGSVLWGQTAFQAGEYGLFSRSFFNLDQFMSYSFLHMLALRVSPPTVNADGRYYDNPLMKDFPVPSDFRHLSEEDLSIVRKAIQERIDKFVDATATNALGTTNPVQLDGAYLR